MDRPRLAVDDPPPDIMNDPSYATNTDREDGMGEADTCRICRGEGGSEPLFHPCKCSGSIKYVHQDCLMEWLSHSQKKHCELCKTPFRFTKLYSPNMPQTLPIHLLFRHILVHAVKNLATWLRAFLVVIVWLVCLPFGIRQVWRLLFWFSDGSWPTVYRGTISKVVQAIQDFLEKSQLEGTSPVTPLEAYPTCSTQTTNLTHALLKYASHQGVTGKESTELFMSLNVSRIEAHYNNLPPQTTLLSEIKFLKNLTRFPHLNQITVGIAEGYIITILVVVCFILIFLIREWVVQQQPGINMGAGFNAEFAVPERPRDLAANPVQIHPARDIGQRPIARPRRRHAHQNAAEEIHRAQPREIATNGEAVDAREESAIQNRPSPVRDALSPAAEIQRRLTEEPRMTEEFLSIWRRAEGDPEEVLRIIENEGKGQQMSYWVNSVKSLLAPQTHNPEFSKGMHSLEGLISPRDSDSILAQNAGSERGSVNSDSWTDIPQSSRSQEESSAEAMNVFNHNTNHKERKLDKGKGKAIEPEDGTVDIHFSGYDRDSNSTSGPSMISRPSIFSSSGSSSRPRAVSDVPPPTQISSAIGNGSWSFTALAESGPHGGDDKFKENKQPGSSEKGSFIASPTIPLSSSQDEATHTWKAAQDKRVEEAIAEERDAQTAEASLPSPKYRNLTEHERTTESRPTADFCGSNVNPEVVESGAEASHHQTPTDDSEHEDGSHQNPELNPFAENTPPSPVRQPIHAPSIEPQGILGNVADFLWGGVGDNVQQEEPPPNDEHIVQDLAAEAPFVPIVHHEEDSDSDEEVEPQDRDVVDAAIAAGLDPNDPDAVDDAEDFEGIMELVGMRGPISSLFQNAIFSAFLLALTVAFGLWIPYNIGRVFLLLLANPGPALKLPLRLIFGCAALVQDMALSVLGLAVYCLVAVSVMPFRSLSAVHGSALGSIVLQTTKIGFRALHLSREALDRILHGPLVTLLQITDSEIFTFSAASHESLIALKTLTVQSLTSIGASMVFIFASSYEISTPQITAFFYQLYENTVEVCLKLSSLLANPETWVISIEIGKRDEPLDLGLSVWNGFDRFWTIVAGYTALCILGALYVRKGTPFSSGRIGREWEAAIIDLLNQAGGVMKVILIISIEMLVFPLYCGLLLDVALLPLFENATIMSRIQFTTNSPLTSIFVHWFVGTCYMFHFALFVSMCRKIMRKGVLYFIRDPDDPTFHPVRDVLERNVATQLRKILFSALIYGALVIICLGGVVWGLSFAFRGVLPIHWSSNEPVLEFPIDLLFYNFLMPLVVKFFKPSDGLQTMYDWWFRKCARMLRLSWFMFDERKKDEEGYNVRRTWGDVVRGAKGNPEKAVNDSERDPFKEDADLHVYFRRNGRYVRAPASDQVRIPKGTKIFLLVDEHNNRVDGEWDSDDGVHGRTSKLYKHIYVPPWFRVRICLFILSIWIFAALTGVGITVIPLVVGRSIFAKIIPSHVRKNDVYAFSIGVYLLGSILYTALQVRQLIAYLRTVFTINPETPQNVLRRLMSTASLVARITWTYTALLFVLPTLFAFLVEFYFIVPLHTYFALEERHVVHFVQSWTLGLLYVKLTTRIILWHEHSRPAQSLRAITRNGYLNPDAKLATRSFILPVGLVLSLALLWPWALARLVTMTVLQQKPDSHVLAYRYAYPMFLAIGCIGFALYLLAGLLKEWRMTIRDEVYLIGERLHNFGDRKVPAVAAPTLRRVET